MNSTKNCTFTTETPPEGGAFAAIAYRRKLFDCNKLLFVISLLKECNRLLQYCYFHRDTCILINY